MYQRTFAMKSEPWNGISATVANWGWAHHNDEPGGATESSPKAVANMDGTKVAWRVRWDGTTTYNLTFVAEVQPQD